MQYSEKSLEILEEVERYVKIHINPYKLHFFAKIFVTI